MNRYMIEYGFEVEGDSIDEAVSLSQSIDTRNGVLLRAIEQKEDKQGLHLTHFDSYLKVVETCCLLN